MYERRIENPARRPDPRFLRLTGAGVTLQSFSVANSPSSRNADSLLADFEWSRGPLVVNGLEASESERSE